MSERKLTFEEFSEKYFEENTELCQCHATPYPPCAFCEGLFVREAYEEYLIEIEEEE